MKTEEKQRDRQPVIAHQILELNQVFTEHRRNETPGYPDVYHHTISEQSFYPIESDTNASKSVAPFCSTSVPSRAVRLFGHRRPTSSSRSMVKPSANGSARPSRMVDIDRPGNDRRASSAQKHGMFVRGRSFYVRWRVPSRLQPIVGKTHFVRSLKTGRWADAVLSIKNNLTPNVEPIDKSCGEVTKQNIALITAQSI